MPRLYLQAKTRGFPSGRATEGTASRLKAEQGRYSAAAVNATDQRLAARGAANTNGVDPSLDLAFVAAGLTKRLGDSPVHGGS
jgi:hypothetical protein